MKFYATCYKKGHTWGSIITAPSKKAAIKHWRSECRRQKAVFEEVVKKS